MPELEHGVVGEFPYAIWEHDSGHLCGYLGLPTTHPWYGLPYDDIDCNVHGGLTYAEANIMGSEFRIAQYRERISSLENDACSSTFPSMAPMAGMYRRLLDEELAEAGKLRDYPIEGFIFDVWWIGFDCAHSGDAPKPGSRMALMEREFLSNRQDTYKDRDYVWHEIERLAEQADAAVRQQVQS